MLRQFISSLLALIFFLAAPSTQACEPCAKDLTFEETVKQADLIIIGEKIAEGPGTDTDQSPGGPDWITVKIIQTLKGNSDKNEINVNSWESMCDYGIVVDDKPYVMLLSKKTSPHEQYEYDAVNNGCSVKKYLFENGSIIMNGQRLPLSDFIEKVSLIQQ